MTTRRGFMQAILAAGCAPTLSSVIETTIAARKAQIAEQMKRNSALLSYMMFADSVVPRQ